MNKANEFIKTINDSIGELKDIIANQEQKIKDLESSNRDLQATIDATEDFKLELIPENLLDKMKLDVLCNLNRNCTLEQLERVENFAKGITTNKRFGKHYITFKP